MPMKPLAGLFLALACILGIASTGSVFVLAYGWSLIHIVPCRPIKRLTISLLPYSLNKTRKTQLK